MSPLLSGRFKSSKHSENVSLVLPLIIHSILFELVSLKNKTNKTASPMEWFLVRALSQVTDGRLFMVSIFFMLWRAEQNKISGDSYKGTNSTQEDSILMNSNGNYLPKSSSLNAITLWGIGFQHMNFWVSQTFSP